MSVYSSDTDVLGMGSVSLLLIGPNAQRRKSIANAVSGQQSSVARELSEYPEVDDLPGMLEADHDAIIIDLDPDPERALDVVENICQANSGVTVMVYSARSDHDLLLRCMRAGAREFLTEPLATSTVAEAMVRAAARRDEVRRPKKKATGKLLVFAGAKGGAGVTTVAANFAVALAKYAGAKTVLVDFELALGDAALTLGVTPKFTIIDGLTEIARLDAEFFSGLLTQHRSGLAVLAAPDQVTTASVQKSAVTKIVGLAKERFSYVVVDAGSHTGEIQEALFEAANAVYLVTQVSVADLRNAHRIIKRFFQDDPTNLHIVLNRYQTRGLEIDEAAVAKALTRLVDWKIPNDYASARKAQNTGVAMASEDLRIARVFADMALHASGQLPAQQKRKKFGLFR